MIGNIIGDMCGSIYEYDEFKDSLIKKWPEDMKLRILKRRLEILKDIPLISELSFYSDDTILTIAILDSLINNRSYEETLKEYGLKYGSAPLNKKNYFEYMFSNNFLFWCRGERKSESLGSGSAMRVAPIGYLYDEEETIIEQATKSAVPSHNTKIAIEGAQAVALAIYYARKKYPKATIKNKITEMFGYDLNYSLEHLRENNRFEYSCDKIVPVALIAFLNSKGFESSIRNAVSLGGDTDTIACITGGIAEAYYGVPLTYKYQVTELLPEEFKQLLNEGYKRLNKLERVKF